ncbi:MAG: type II toxin-antitoxin system HicA family toxin [Phycisphaerales bacterium]|nr:type II toxin-antitoxin system HicA family toxin [Phycisphaerales bacterium]
MSGLPVVSGRQTVAAPQRVGYQVARQKGSHIRLRHPTDPKRQPVTIPDHKELKTGTLRATIRDAGLLLEEFQRLL